MGHNIYLWPWVYLCWPRQPWLWPIWSQSHNWGRLQRLQDNLLWDISTTSHWAIHKLHQQSIRQIGWKRPFFRISSMILTHYWVSTYSSKFCLSDVWMPQKVMLIFHLQMWAKLWGGCIPHTGNLQDILSYTCTARRRDLRLTFPSFETEEIGVTEGYLSCCSF